MIYCAHADNTYYPDGSPFGFASEWYVEINPVFSSREVRVPEERFHLENMLMPGEHGKTLDPTVFPTQAMFDNTVDTPADFYRHQGWWTVSTRAKEKIEEFEPGVHQFVPFKLLQADGSDPWPPYYFFNIRQVIFSFDEAKSPCYKWHRWWHSPAGDMIYGSDGTKSRRMHIERAGYKLQYDPKLSPGVTPDGRQYYIVHRASAVGNRLIWRERLDLDTPPNSGKRLWMPHAQGSVFLDHLEPAEPGEWDIYELDFYMRRAFWVTESFKAWVEAEGITGLVFHSPGCLDSELEG
jgi:hypothetical protein